MSKLWIIRRNKQSIYIHLLFKSSLDPSELENLLKSHDNTFNLPISTQSLFSRVLFIRKWTGASPASEWISYWKLTKNCVRVQFCCCLVVVLFPGMTSIRISYSCSACIYNLFWNELFYGLCTRYYNDISYIMLPNWCIMVYVGTI